MDSEFFEQKGLQLLDKGKRGFFRLLFSRTWLMAGLVLVQVGILLAIGLWLEEWLPHAVVAYVACALGMVLYLLSADQEPTVKLTWLVLIMVLPIFGGLLYLFTRRDLGHRVLRHRLKTIHIQTAQILPQEEETMEALAHTNSGTVGMVRYVQRSGCFPVYRNTQVTYFSSGEAKFQRLLEELEKAEKYIFLEYFIVEEGEMWGEILEILAKKAAQGLDVRVMYDGTCEFALLPKSYPRKLRQLGIQCKVFSPVTPFLSTHYNYRDHRKILLIDGHTAFTGGVNLADEYINRRERFGHWKDTALMLQGEAARSFGLMFLQMWNLTEKEPVYQPWLAEVEAVSAPGFVMPYGDSPMDADRVGEQVYIDILNRAEKYVHIMTPYLILDYEMENALCYAAKRGVQVRIMLPGIPDKALPYAMAKSHFRSLLAAGVELYLYTPGFLHAKCFVSDDREAVVGTINLDYRSLYHHFECGVYLLEVPAVADVEADFQQTLEQCQQVTEETVAQEHFFVKLTGFLLKVLAPLL